MGQRLYSSGDAAREIGVTRDALTWALRQGAPAPAHRTGGRRVFTAQEVEVLRAWFLTRRERCIGRDWSEGNVREKAL